MGTSWANNLYLAPVMGPVSDEKMKDIPYPTPELMIHITYKTVQIGSVFGAVAAGAHKVFGGKKLMSVAAAAKRAAYLRRGVFFGLVAGPVMTLARVQNQTSESIYDRDYRLRHNRGQLLTDRVTTVTALSGLLIRGLPGVALGTVAGLAGVGAYNVYNAQTAKSPKSDATTADSPKSGKQVAAESGDNMFDQIAKRARDQQAKFERELAAKKVEAEKVKEDVKEEVKKVKEEVVSHSPWLFNTKWSSKTQPLGVDDHVHDQDGACPWVDSAGGKKKDAGKGKGCSLCHPAPMKKLKEACKCGCHA